MDENKKITTGGIIFLCYVGNVFMIGSGSALTAMALLTLLIKSRK